MKNIAKSLAKFHDLMGNVAKDANNPFFKSKYAPLETILPAIKGPLKEAGLVFFQAPTWIGDNSPALATTLIDIESGEKIETVSPIILAKQDPQGQGSAITYMRRYALVAMLGLNCDEDDDGNAASPKVAPKATTAPKSEAPELTPKETAINYINEANTVDRLQEINKSIVSSKKFSSDDKTDLVAMIMNKLDKLDPLND